jgi:hypothetical protein
MDYTLDFFSNKNEAMFGRKLSGVLGGVIFELDILSHLLCIEQFVSIYLFACTGRTRWNEC